MRSSLFTVILCVPAIAGLLVLGACTQDENASTAERDTHMGAAGHDGDPAAPPSCRGQSSAPHRSLRPRLLRPWPPPAADAGGDAALAAAAAGDAGAADAAPAKPKHK